ncbi:MULTISPECIES: type IV toxin-antitoxin system AbiEi family antitoxin domain-containing protein [Rothia]|uniref:DUF559 domain-containing protein n=1 Tax=Rothia nasimurium TaxID=85336 RepID=A0A1Y1RTK1_9MICC|nr:MULTISPECIES: type IV toxin-antitoxin system AbiEi family antitoxin domain-containing protein [Rothia]ORC25047.1 hypothetical protein A7979_08470 [Rothia nasimurium]
MPPDLATIRSALSTHQQLSRSGLSNKKISALYQRGELVRLTRGVYLNGSVARECDRRDRAIAVTLALALKRRTAVVSHQSAALLWGAPLISLPAKVHFSLRSVDNSGHKQATFHSYRPDSCDQAVDLHGVRVTPPLLTVSDCVKTLPVSESLAITDYFLRTEALHHAQIQSALHQLRGPGAHRASIVTRIMSPYSETPLESLACLRLYEDGLDSGIQQFEIRTPSGRLYRADFAWPSQMVILEVDGLHKYFGIYRKTEEQLRNDALRQRELELAGWAVIRATWEDLTQRPHIVTSKLRSLGVPNIINTPGRFAPTYGV